MTEKDISLEILQTVDVKNKDEQGYKELAKTLPYRNA